MPRQRHFAVGVVVALLMAVSATVVTAAPTRAERFKLTDASDFARPSGSPQSPIVAMKERRGYLVPDAAAYDAQKRALDAEAAASRHDATTRRVGGPSPLAPVIGPNFLGADDPNSAPSDSTGAIGRTRYIELINREYQIFSRSGASLGAGTLDVFFNAAGTNAFDPQVIWDAQTSRFYYAGDIIAGGPTYYLAFGFSKTDSPNSSADFCQYFLNYGTVEFPDYPKLGDTKDFILIGSNVFTSSFLRSDVAAITKPPAGSTCPAASSFGVTVAQGLKKSDGTTSVFTPVPGQQVDTSGTGWIVSRDFNVPSTSFTIHRVTRNANGSANIPLTGSNLAVPIYDLPANATMPGTLRTLDTLDTRPTQAVLARNPLQGNTFSLWTQHTVKSGTRSQVRWYEINPAAPSIRQSGNVVFNGFAFNGAISPDRQVNGATARFGSNFVLGYSTSSNTTNPAIRARSKIGAGAISAPVTVIVSPGSYAGFDCPGGGDNDCRWGDYASATPDPVVAAAATAGRVWITNTYASGNQNTSQANWRTRNAAIVP